MKLSDVTLPISVEWGRAHALVFSLALAQRLAEIHFAHGSIKCVPVPLLLADGRLMLCADLLTEVGPGGLLHAMWQAADQAVLLSSVQVLPWESAIALLPADIPSA
jgi:hypothetical protein